MTVSSSVSRWEYIGNGSQTQFQYTTKIFAKTDLKVYVSNTLQTVDVDYTVTNVGSPGGGNVVFVSPPLNGKSVVIFIDLELTQLTNFVDGDKLPAEALEACQDRAVMMIQRLADKLNKAIRLPDYSLSSGELPTDLIPNYFLKVDSTGTSFELEAVVPEGVSLTPYVKLDGRLGGQTICGGAYSGEDLTLKSTSHPTPGRVGVADSTFHINVDYASGDEDAILKFNRDMANITLEYLSNLNVRQFTLSERTRLFKTMNAAGDFGNDSHAWALRTEAGFDFSTWTLGTKVGITHQLSLENKLNSTTPELAMSYGYVYNLTSNSKAAVYGYGVDIIKQSPCTTDNTMICFNALICSDVNPSALASGVAFRATSQDLGSYTGVRQNFAFFAGGDRGWKFPLYFVDTDNSTVLTAVDQYGNAYFKGQVQVAGDSGGTAGRVTFSAGTSGYSNGTGSTAPRSITGSNNPTFWGYLKFYVGTTPIYVPGYSAIQ